MNAKSKAKLHAIAEKWLGKECVLLHVKQDASPEKLADYAEIVSDCMNIGRIVVCFRPPYGLRVCSRYGRHILAIVPLENPAPKIRLAI